MRFFSSLLFVLTLHLCSGCVYKSGRYQPLADTYTVRRGDTLSSIAFELTGETSHWKTLARANPHVNPERLVPGQVISIPRYVRNSSPLPARRPGSFRFREPAPADKEWQDYPPHSDRLHYPERNEPKEMPEKRDPARDPDLKVVPLSRPSSSGGVTGMGLGAVNNRDDY